MSHEIFPNQFPERLLEELRIGSNLKIIPAEIGSPEFEAMINMGTIKWVLSQENKILIMPHTIDSIELNHPILVNGEAVLSAGEAEIAGNGGEYFGLAINNHSGHYQPSAASLDLALQKFRDAGIFFDRDSIEQVG